MPLPANVNTGVVVGHFVDSSGGLLNGNVRFIPSPSNLTNPGAIPPTFIISQEVTAPITNGDLEVTLVATDDPDSSPVDWTYQVIFEIYNSSETIDSFHISVPSDETVDLIEVAPAASSNGVQILTPRGIPAGGTPGQILVKETESDYELVWDDLDEAPTQEQITTWLLDPAEDLGAAALQVASRARDEIYIGLGVLQVLGGSPAQGLVGPVAASRERVMLMDASTDEAIGASIRTPAEWTTMQVTMLWTNSATSTGDVRFGLAHLQYDAGDNVATAATELGDQTMTAPGTAGPTLAFVWPVTITLTGKDYIRIVLVRRASNVADTLPNDAAVIGLLLERLT